MQFADTFAENSNSVKMFAMMQFVLTTIQCKTAQNSLIFVEKMEIMQYKHRFSPLQFRERIFSVTRRSRSDESH